MTKAVFITGTDTDVGKTYIACGILAAAKIIGLSTAAIKPVAAGAVKTKFGLRNEDALALHEQCTLPLSAEQESFVDYDHKQYRRSSHPPPAFVAQPQHHMILLLWKKSTKFYSCLFCFPLNSFYDSAGCAKNAIDSSPSHRSCSCSDV